MLKNSDYIALAERLRNLGAGHLIDEIRAALDLARSECSWDQIHGISQLLGSHRDALATAIAGTVDHDVNNAAEFAATVDEVANGKAVRRRA